MQRFQRRCTATFVAVIIIVGGSLALVSPAAAAVPTPDPTAIGQSNQDDLQVLAADADAADSPVKIHTYKVGLPADVKAQRWTFETVTSGTVPVYHIRQLSSGRCLQADTAANGSNLVLADCSTAAQQLWTTGTTQTFPTYGFDLRDKRDGRCLDLYDSSDGQPATMWDCESYYSTQMWRTRVGGFDCGDRSVVALCVQTTEPLFGVMANWRQQPVSFNGPPSDPDSGPGFNQLDNQIDWNPLDSQGADTGYDYEEMGWRATYSTDDNATLHEAYWLEDGPTSEEYHPIAEPDSTLADGSVHTWMSLSNSSAQWDMLYDFNPVGTSRFATGRQTRSIQYGLLPQYAQYSTLGTGFEDRVQILDGNSVWRRPRLGETAQFAANLCGQPDPLSIQLAQPPAPPYCFTTSVVPRASATPASPPEVDRFLIGKPAAGAFAFAPASPPAAPSTPPTAVYHGVDQHKLAACMASDPGTCLATVPGLSQCVRAREICNVTAASTPKLSGSPVTADRARRRAEVDLHDTNTIGATATTVTAAEFTRRSGVTLPVDGTAAVHVIASPHTVSGLTGHTGRSYQGYLMVYLAGTGQTLYGCLGQTCNRKEFS